MRTQTYGINRKECNDEMKPLSVSQIRTIIAGKLIQGSDDAAVHFGAYRLKQIKNPNTIFFSKKVILNPCCR